MNWKTLLLPAEASILDAMRCIDAGAMQIALVADAEGRLLGIVTDGDIRRGLLRGLELASPAHAIMNRNPLTVRKTEGRLAALELMRAKDLRHIPVVDADNKLQDIWTLQDLLQFSFVPNPVVLMAGGQGKRLGELTKDCPKPLLKVGGKPILETIVENFAEAGFRNFWLSINYKAEMVENHFGDGSKWGLNIQYLRETEPLGTAGALSLLPEPQPHTLLVMNGDILTKISPRALLESHENSGAPATMAVKTYEMQVPYGVIVQDATGRILGIEEKPVQKFSVSAGIYAISPTAMRHIPPKAYFDMPDLFKALIAAGTPPMRYELNDYWMDIGHIADYQRANEEFIQHFNG